MALRDLFTDADLAAVRTATEAAESRSGGELVCVVVERSDSYDEARWRAATLGALGGGLIAAYGFWALDAWSPLSFLWPALMPLLGIAIGWLIATTVSAIERELASASTLSHRVHQRAVAAFASEGVAKTRRRTGVLIFLSLFERRVELLCDEGIRNVVPADRWQQLTRRLASGIADGEAGLALVAAVEAVGELLVEAGIERDDDDVNELADEPRLLDE